MNRLTAQLDAVEASMPFGVVGQVQAISGMTIEASDLTLPLGSLCQIHSFGGKTSRAEVIGFRQDRTLLSVFFENDKVASVQGKGQPPGLPPVVAAPPVAATPAAAAAPTPAPTSAPTAK